MVPAPLGLTADSGGASPRHGANARVAMTVTTAPRVVGLRSAERGFPLPALALTGFPTQGRYLAKVFARLPCFLVSGLAVELGPVTCRAYSWTPFPAAFAFAVKAPGRLTAPAIQSPPPLSPLLLLLLPLPRLPRARPMCSSY